MSSTDTETIGEPNTKKLKASINSIWVIFDLETTSFNRVTHEIIKIGALILGDNGKQLDKASFLLFIKPKSYILPTITKLIGINNHNVHNAPPFAHVGYTFLQFILETITKYEYDENISVQQTILVAHNGKLFLPFLLHALKTAGLWKYWDIYKDKLFILNTLHLSRKVLHNQKQNFSNYRLSTVYDHVSGNTLENNHCAMHDVEATVTILQYGIFWEKRMYFVEPIDWDENVLDEKKTMETQMEICWTWTWTQTQT